MRTGPHRRLLCARGREGGAACAGAAFHTRPAQPQGGRLSPCRERLADQVGQGARSCGGRTLKKQPEAAAAARRKKKVKMDGERDPLPQPRPSLPRPTPPLHTIWRRPPPAPPPAPWSSRPCPRPRPTRLPSRYRSLTMWGRCTRMVRDRGTGEKREREREKKPMRAVGVVVWGVCAPHRVCLSVTPTSERVARLSPAVGWVGHQMCAGRARVLSSFSANCIEARASFLSSQLTNRPRRRQGPLRGPGRRLRKGVRSQAGPVHEVAR